ncbi:hypothetical protein A3860_36885 [Niastella vici]|uniref:TonB-dependent receptor plug domain-containing protein n=1 Tax=Niastella vici TaxID=1703345 RepID=A0A1V9FMJ0_9BACT|nr:TonB-dependent receptor plug domain-containing protein [Niastella vici]OQP59569.1 hypothetical protein A3860_36885 [Niastella vici]
MCKSATLISIVSFLLLITKSGTAQKLNFSFNVDSAEAKTVLAKFSDITGLGLSIQENALDGAKKLSIHENDKPFFKVFEKIYKDQPFYCYIVAQTIIVARRISAETTAGSKPIDSWGQFTNDWGEGVENVFVYNAENIQVTHSNSYGNFFVHACPGAVFTYGSKDVETGSFTLPNSPTFSVQVHYRPKGAYLAPVEVIHTGIAQLLKRRSIGSSFVVAPEVIQQRSAQNIYDRLEGVTPGFLLTVNKVPNTNQAKYATIGGRSTIFSGADPMIVVNNFPWHGRWEDIDPDDVESITILRDASATALWGAMAGNSVIVITTKSGKFNHPLRVSFNAAVSVGTKTDAFEKDRLAPTDRFFIDTFLTHSGYYNFLAKSPSHPYVPEVALRILNKSISNDQLEALKDLDIRNDMNKYFYRNIFQKHFSLQVSGSQKNHAYLFSAGFDHSLPELQLSKTQRLNLSLNYNMRPAAGLEISFTGATTYSQQRNTDNEPAIPVTYANLVDSLGDAAAQAFKRNKLFTDTAGVDASGRRKLNDWAYRPLKEFRLRNDNNTQTDHRVQVSVKYDKFPFVKGLEAGVYTQYQEVTSEEKDLKNKDGFFVNDLVNSYTQINGTEVDRPIPWGNILDYSHIALKTWNIRAQLSYVKTIGHSNILSAMLGNDRLFTNGDYLVKRIYDYTTERPEGADGLNYQTLYRQYYFPSSQLYIPYLNDAKRTASNYLSWYTYTNLQLKGKYFASVALRADRSNIYGSQTNKRLNPLGSVAAAWDISAEHFFHPRLIEFLKLRSSLGVSGNPPLGVSAIQTLTMKGINEYGDQIADINNPSLPNLRWERVLTYNLGLNFRLRKQVLEGSIDYYYKKSTDLVGKKWVDPTTGMASMMDNAAAMAAHNIDVYLTSRNLNKRLRWRTTFLLSYVKDYVTKTDTALQPAWMYCDPNWFSVVPNRPLYGIYSFPSEGLDVLGDPIGPGKNKDYQSMTQSPGVSALTYRGPSLPPVFGSLTNEFNWKQFNLSFTFSYKFNFYYRKQGVTYTGIFGGTNPGSADFAKRWQKPGDEDRTDVPRMQYPADRFRDYFYLYSDRLVKRADFIRLQNIHFSYDLEGVVLRKLHMRLANLYVNCNNAGIIWRATKSNLDPDRLLGYPQPTIVTFGFKGVLK